MKETRKPILAGPEEQNIYFENLDTLFITDARVPIPRSISTSTRSSTASRFGGRSKVESSPIST